MCWPTPKSWPTLAFTHQTHVKSQHTPTRKHGVHGAMAHTESCRFRLAFILCFSSKKQQKAMEKQKGLGKIIHKIIHFNATSSIFFCLFAASLYPLDEISHKSGHDWISSINLKVASLSRSDAGRINSSAILWVSGKSRDEWTNFDWLKFSNTCLFIVHTSNASWPTRKKVGENRDKFYLSPTVGQHVVVSFTHANVSWPTQVGQQKFVVWRPLYIISFYLVMYMTRRKWVWTGSTRFPNWLSCGLLGD